jgi:cell cycle sensor histidine kinase DivJ
LSNAIRFSDRGGKVTIGARAEAGSVVITVEDSGVGISESDLQRVGEPYFQARASYDRRHGGTGLGLSIVRGLVRLHGGELSIRSRVGEGTRVTVLLPLDCERARSANRPIAAVGHDVDNRAGYFKRPVPAASVAAPPAVNGAAPAQNEIVVKKSA